jgi:hypothetical protein
MNSQPQNPENDDYFDRYLERSLGDDRPTDATVYWFRAAVLFAFLAAGIIVYRAGTYEVRTAANDMPPAAARLDPLSPAPILPR